MTFDQGVAPVVRIKHRSVAWKPRVSLSVVHKPPRNAAPVDTACRRGELVYDRRVCCTRTSYRLMR